MQKQLLQALDNHGFDYGAYEIGKGKKRVQMNGKEVLRKWNQQIGFSNPKHRKKVDKFLPR